MLWPGRRAPRAFSRSKRPRSRRRGRRGYAGSAGMPPPKEGEGLSARAATRKRSPSRAWRPWWRRGSAERRRESELEESRAAPAALEVLFPLLPPPTATRLASLLLLPLPLLSLLLPPQLARNTGGRGRGSGSVVPTADEREREKGMRKRSRERERERREIKRDKKTKRKNCNRIFSR